MRKGWQWIQIVLVIHLMIAVALIGVVLMQKSEGGALGIGGRRHVEFHDRPRHRQCADPHHRDPRRLLHADQPAAGDPAAARRTQAPSIIPESSTDPAAAHAHGAGGAAAHGTGQARDSKRPHGPLGSIDLFAAGEAGGACPCTARRAILSAHDAVHLHHRRRGLLPRQRYLGSGARRAAAGARLQGAPAQARSLSQCRSGHHEPDPAWRGLCHRRRRGDRSRSRPLRALHRRAQRGAATTSPPAASIRP